MAQAIVAAAPNPRLDFLDFRFSTTPVHHHPVARGSTPPFDRLRAGSDSGGEFRKAPLLR